MLQWKEEEKSTINDIEPIYRYSQTKVLVISNP